MPEWVSEILHKNLSFQWNFHINIWIFDTDANVKFLH